MAFQEQVIDVARDPRARVNRIDVRMTIDGLRIKKKNTPDPEARVLLDRASSGVTAAEGETYREAAKALTCRDLDGTDAACEYRSDAVRFDIASMASLSGMLPGAGVSVTAGKYGSECVDCEDPCEPGYYNYFSLEARDGAFTAQSVGHATPGAGVTDVMILESGEFVGSMRDLKAVIEQKVTEAREKRAVAERVNAAGFVKPSRREERGYERGE